MFPSSYRGVRVRSVVRLPRSSVSVPLKGEKDEEEEGMLSVVTEAITIGQ